MKVSVEAPLKPLPAPVAPFIATPTALIAAPQSTLQILQTAAPAPDFKIEQQLALGRKTFDAQNVQMSAFGTVATVSATPLAPYPALSPIAPSTTRAAVEVPASHVHKAVDYSMPSPNVMLALTLVVLALLSLGMRRAAPPRPAAPPLGDAAHDFDSLKTQTVELSRALADAARYARKPQDVSAALDKAWYEFRFAGGVSRLENGAWAQTPIAPEVFAALDLPKILRILRPTDPRYFDKVGDLLRGIPLEAERALDADDLLKRLAWWKAHFAQFPG